MNECSKIKSTEQKNWARPYFDLFIEPIVLDQEKPILAEFEWKALMAIEEAVFKNPVDYYQVLSRLSALLSFEHRGQESQIYLMRCIKIAEVPKNSYEWELPDLYMRLAIIKMDQRKIDEANKTFYKALNLEKDKNGFHTAIVWLFWGWSLRHSQQLSSAKEKLNMALKIARALPCQKRGTVVIDASLLLAKIEESLGNKKESQLALQDFASEMQAQQKINSGIGPELYKGNL